MRNYWKLFYIAYKKVLVVLTEQEAPDNGKVHMLLQKCGFSLWDLPYVTLLAPTIRGWILDFWKICGPLL